MERLQYEPSEGRRDSGTCHAHFVHFGECGADCCQNNAASMTVGLAAVQLVDLGRDFGLANRRDVIDRVKAEITQGDMFSRESGWHFREVTAAYGRFASTRWLPGNGRSYCNQ